MFTATALPSRVVISSENHHRTTSVRPAEGLSFTSGGLTRLIARMEAAGLLVRHPHPDDRRAAFLEASPKGRELLERALAAHVPQITADLMEPLTPVERMILRELVSKPLTHSARGTVPEPSRPRPGPGNP
ncbi:MarR family winged helix-turn-helix transcriptional regulator [Streptomyces lomondensis]|uniref:MarR family winged helix-turn-helix transcriptional regulator n=1 Tax=Streptomyces lomondensis TaxID=68229 RepID=UPI001E591B6C|nr:MarR family transcriptional regulator [Streptomyces lomondensis]MCF0080862.1 winged helix DNA-binding protein [Streptomyces lomondensis]